METAPTISDDDLVYAACNIVDEERGLAELFRVDRGGRPAILIAHDEAEARYIDRLRHHWHLPQIPHWALCRYGQLKENNLPILVDPDAAKDRQVRQHPHALAGGKAFPVKSWSWRQIDSGNRPLENEEALPISAGCEWSLKTTKGETYTGSKPPEFRDGLMILDAGSAVLSLKLPSSGG